MKRGLWAPKFCWQEAGWENCLAENICYFSLKRKEDSECGAKSPEDRVGLGGLFSDVET